MKPEAIAERIALGISHDLHEGLIPGVRVPLDQLAAVRERIAAVVLLELTQEPSEECCDDEYYDDDEDWCDFCDLPEYECECDCCDCCDDPNCDGICY